MLGAPLQRGVIELETLAGIVPVALERDESGAHRVRPHDAARTAGRGGRGSRRACCAAIGAERSALPIELYDNGARHILVMLDDASELGRLARDGDAIAALEITGVNVFARSGDGWRNRMFWAHGEDPATGSAAGPIACHLARHGLIAWGEEIVIAQGVEMGRPSTLHARAEGGDGLIDAVEVGGAAVVVARGEYRLRP